MPQYPWRDKKPGYPWRPKRAAYPWRKGGSMPSVDYSDIPPQPTGATTVDPHGATDLPYNPVAAIAGGVEEGFFAGDPRGGPGGPFAGMTEDLVKTLDLERHSFDEGLPGQRMFESDVAEGVRRVVGNFALEAQEFAPVMASSLVEDPAGTLAGLAKFFPELGLQAWEALGRPTGNMIIPFMPQGAGKQAEALRNFGENPLGLALAALPFAKGVVKPRLSRSALISDVAGSKGMKVGVDPSTLSLPMEVLAPTIDNLIAKRRTAPKGAADRSADPTAPTTGEWASLDRQREVTNVMRPTDATARAGLAEALDLPNEGLAIELVDATRRIGAPARYRPQKQSLGFFTPLDRKTSKTIIAMRDIQKTGTLAHELGHGIDYRLGGDRIIRGNLVSRIPPDIAGKFKLTDRVARAELKALTQLPRPFDPAASVEYSKRYRHSAPELFADFMSVYFHDRGLAHRTAPKFTAAFEETMTRPEFGGLQSVIQDVVSVAEAKQPRSPLFPVTVEQTAASLRRPIARNVREAAELGYLDAVRERKAQVFRAESNARAWRGKLSDTQLEDVGAYVEGIGNIGRKGDTFAAVESRMTPEMRDVAKRYRFETELARQEINKFLEKTGKKEYIQYIEDYLSHLYVRDKPMQQLVGRWRKSIPQAQKRRIPTLKEAMDEGLTPLTQDVSILHKKWAETVWGIGANMEIVRSLKNLKMADGTDAVVVREPVGEGWVYFDHPAIRKVYGRKNKKGETVLRESGVWFHPDIAKVATKAFENPYKDITRFGKIYDAIGDYAKGISLALSGFHAFALVESAQAAFATGRNPIRGAVLLGREALEFGKSPIRLTSRVGKQLQKNIAFTEDAIRHGLMVGGGVSEASLGRIMNDLISLEARTRNVPGLSTATKALRKGKEGFDKVLWEELHEGYKLFAYYDITRKALMEAPPNISAYEIKTTIAEHINNAFGGQEWEAKFWLSPTGLKYARRTLLAPDWTYSNAAVAASGPMELARIAKKGTYPGPTGKMKVEMNARYWRNSMLTFLGVTQGLNYALNGKPTWENEVDHEWDIDITELWRKLPWSDPDDLSRKYIKLFKQAREVGRYVTEPWQILGNKLNPVTREVLKQVDPFGRFAEYVSGDSDLESIPDRLESAVKVFIPFSLSGNNFAFSLPMSKGMTEYKGMRAFQAALDAKEYVLFGEKVMQPDAIAAVHDALRSNGVDPKPVFRWALSSVRSAYYKDFFEAYEEQDVERMDELAARMVDLHVTQRGLAASMKIRGLMPDEADMVSKGFDFGDKGSLYEALQVKPDIK